MKITQAVPAVFATLAALTMKTIMTSHSRPLAGLSGLFTPNRKILTGLKLKLLPSAERRATMLLAILCLAFIIFPLPARAQQACVPPPQGILAWWPFDETSGPIAAELIGGRVGTWFNSPTPAPGEVGNALEFNGTNYVGVADDPVWSFGPERFLDRVVGELFDPRRGLHRRAEQYFHWS